MNSIRKKLFFYIGGLIILLIILLILANTLLLEPYYIYNEKQKLLNSYNIINSLDTSDYEYSLSEFIGIESTSNIDILLTKDNGVQLYTSNSYLIDDDLHESKMHSPYKISNKNVNTQEKLHENQNIEITNVEYINENINILWETDLSFNILNLVLEGTLDNGCCIKLRIPRPLIETNILLSNKFTLIIGGFLFVISMLFAYIISNNFTKPIRAINKVTKNMKNLKFDTFCVVSSKDELGQLAESINEMSAELSNTIGALNDKNSQLIEQDEKRRELLNNVSHELKTPLALMQGYAEGLKLNVLKSKEKSDFYCDVIMDEAIKMNQLVESLLNINQMEFGDKTLYKTIFEANTFFESILNKYEKIFDSKHIVCTINQTKAIEVFADSLMMESAFTNYINNAINYVDNNKKIEVSIIDLNNKVRIEVFNTAKAIPEEDTEKIWNSFYKLDKARTREKGGYGLGLSIVKAILEAHSNAYGVKNINNGVCFWFEIDKSFENKQI